MGNRTGYPVLRPGEVNGLLKALLWEEFEWSRMAFGWMAAATKYEWKTKLGYIGYLHIENVRQLEERIRELPGGLNERQGPPAEIRSFCTVLAAAPSDIAFLYSYRIGLRRLYDQYDQLIEQLDPILEAPTLHRLKRILVERESNLSWLQDQLRHAYVDDPAGFTMFTDWKRYINSIIQGQPEARPVTCSHMAGPLPATGANDPRFIPADKERVAQLYSSPENSPFADTVRQMIYVNATEIIAAESLTFLYGSAEGMPLAFYSDLARHIWDEARHSQMGIRRLLQFGYRIEDFRFFPPHEMRPGIRIGQLVESYDSLTQVVEACSFTSKRKTAEALWSYNDPLSAVQSEYDVADERLHVDFGSRWGEELHRLYCDDAATTKQIVERARRNHLEQQNYSAAEIEELTRSAVSFCGATGLSLRFDRYDAAEDKQVAE